VRGHVQPLRVRREAAPEELFETQRPVLIDHSSGNARLSSVERR
jgi:hypothetical protein